LIVVHLEIQHLCPIYCWIWWSSHVSSIPNMLLFIQLLLVWEWRI